jgi:hypothetical protein
VRILLRNSSQTARQFPVLHTRQFIPAAQLFSISSAFVNLPEALATDPQFRERFDQ